MLPAYAGASADVDGGFEPSGTERGDDPAAHMQAYDRFVSGDSMHPH
jgi:hypothetical protein